MCVCVDNVVMEGVIQDNDLLDQVPVVDVDVDVDVMVEEMEKKVEDFFLKYL